MAEIMEKLKPSRATAWERMKRIFRHESAVLAIVLVALVGGLAVITGGLTLTRANIVNTMLASVIRGLAAIGQTFVILTAGIDVSVGGLALFLSNFGARLMTSDTFEHLLPFQVPIYAGIPIVLLVGAGFGAINGSLVSRIGVPPLIVTLGMWRILKGFSLALGRGHNITKLESLDFIGLGVIGGVPVLIIIFIVAAVIAYYVLYYNIFGRSVYATGGNPSSAWLSGIKVRNIQFSVYVIAGFMGALAAVLTLGRLGQASPLTASGLELDSIAAATVGGISLAGGRGSLIGVVIGTLIIGVTNNGMSVLGASPAMRDIVRGAIIFTAVAVDYIRRR